MKYYRLSHIRRAKEQQNGVFLIKDATINLTLEGLGTGSQARQNVSENKRWQGSFQRHILESCVSLHCHRPKPKCFWLCCGSATWDNTEVVVTRTQTMDPSQMVTSPIASHICQLHGVLCQGKVQDLLQISCGLMDITRPHSFPGCSLGSCRDHSCHPREGLWNLQLKEHKSLKPPSVV